MPRERTYVLSSDELQLFALVRHGTDDGQFFLHFGHLDRARLNDRDSGKGYQTKCE